MSSFREPSFQDRVGLAARAKKKALDQLRAAPKVDAATRAELQAAHREREAALQAERDAKQAALLEAKAAKRALIVEAKAEEVAPVITDEDRKAARDARYAARKGRR
jgi:hypothetical protein